MEVSCSSLAQTVDVSTETPVQVWLLQVAFEEGRVQFAVGIKWDRERKQFVFDGDEELLAPAARRFFDEVLFQAADWLKEYL